MHFGCNPLPETIIKLFQDFMDFLITDDMAHLYFSSNESVLSSCAKGQLSRAFSSKRQD
jgi:hypothetical protein